MITLSERSLQKLEGVHEHLVKVVMGACKISVVDFFVLEGLRSVQRQKELYSQGRTKPGKIVTWTMNSTHLWGHAVDLGALVNGKYIDGDTPEELKLYDKIANAMLESAAKLTIPLVWGVKKKDGTITDKGHFNLNQNFYKRRS